MLYEDYSKDHYENYYKLMELYAGYLNILPEVRAEFIKKMPATYPENIKYGIDGRFEDEIKLKDWYQSAMEKFVIGNPIGLTIGEVVAIKAVIVCCDIKFSLPIKSLFGEAIYFHVLKASDRFALTILPLLSKKERDWLVENYTYRAQQFVDYAKNTAKL